MQPRDYCGSDPSAPVSESTPRDQSLNELILGSLRLVSEARRARRLHENGGVQVRLGYVGAPLVPAADGERMTGYAEVIPVNPRPHHYFRLADNPEYSLNYPPRVMLRHAVPVEAWRP